MNLTPLQRRYFIDPIQDPLIKTDSVLVTEERRYQRGAYVDKITKVTGRSEYGNRIWWVTEEGDHVMGAPVNPPHVGYDAQLIGLLSDDLFIIGRYDSGANTGAIRINRALRSDQLAIPGCNTPGSGYEAPGMVATSWVKAAPWAMELMPIPSDTPAVTSAKLELAEQRWNHRRAKAIFRTEAIFRDWEDKLEDLNDSHDLLTPVFGALFKGEVIVPLSMQSTLTFDPLDEQRITQVKDQALRSDSGTGRPMVTISAEVPILDRIENREGMEALSFRSIRDNVRAHLNHHSAVVGDHNLTPVLRSAS